MIWQQYVVCSGVGGVGESLACGCWLLAMFCLKFCISPLEPCTPQPVTRNPQLKTQN